MSREHPSVVVVVVTWEGEHLLGACLRSLEAQSLAHEVVVVDNASTDGTLDLLRREHPAAVVVSNPTNSGFAGGVQRGLDHVAAHRPGTEYVGLLNNDAVAEPGWLAALVAAAEDYPGVAAVTSRMYLTDHQPPLLNNTGVVLAGDAHGMDRGLFDAADAWDQPGEVFGFSGGAALLRRAAVEQVGGFPVPFFLYYEDTDTSWRLRRAGWQIRYEPGAVVHHQHSASTDQSSAMFAFYNERNRLLTALRNAPTAVVVQVWARYVVTTASVAARGHGHARAHNHRAGLRLRALASALRLAPWAFAARRGPGAPWAPAGVSGRPA